jgi:hypothetical protein
VVVTGGVLLTGGALVIGGVLVAGGVLVTGGLLVPGVPPAGDEAAGNVDAGNGAGGVAPRPNDHAHVTLDRASGGWIGPSCPFTSVVLVRVICVSLGEASILCGCHSCTVATSCP